MGPVLASVLQKAPLTPEKVAFAWRQAVGAGLDRATTIALEGAVLRVHTKDTTWRREVERSAAVIRKRLDSLLGAGVVGRIEVV